MKPDALIAAMALLAASAAPAMPAAIAARLCTGDSAARNIRIPLAPAAPAPADDDHRCLKACHATTSRKRNVSDI